MMSDIKENRQYWSMMMKTGPQASGPAISSYISSTYRVGAAMVRERWRFDRWATPCLRLAPDTVYCCRFQGLPFFLSSTMRFATLQAFMFAAMFAHASFFLCVIDVRKRLIIVTLSRPISSIMMVTMASEKLAFCDFRCETVKKIGKNVIK